MRYARLTISAFPRRIAACIALGALVSGCTKVGPSAPGGRHTYTKPHVLRFAAASEIQQLNPLIDESQYEEYLASMTMAWLIKTDSKGDATVPELATEIPSQQNRGISRDGKTITFHLRHGVVWSDGAPFDADDVVWTTKQVLNPKNNVVSTDGWDQITKIDEPDKYTVVYHVKAPYSSFAITFFSTGGANPAILPKHLLQKYASLNNLAYNSLPVGIGPFKYKEWRRGDSITLVANDRYFRGRPKLDEIVYRTVQDRNTVLQLLRTHDIDLWVPISPHYFPTVKAIRGMATLSLPSYTFDHLDFNLKNPVLRDPAVRQALQAALDRKTIIDKVQNGLYLLSETPVSPASFFHLDLPLVPYSIAKANALLDAAGWQRGSDGIRAKHGRRLALEFATSTGSADTDTEIELIRASWKQLGVAFTVKHYQAQQFFAPAGSGGVMYGGKFDVVLFGWGSSPIADLSNLYACYRFPPNGQNDMRWCDQAATAAMDRAKYTYDPQARRRDIDFVQRQLALAVPTVVIDIRRELFGFNDDLKDFHPNPVSPFDDMMQTDI